MKNRPPTLHYTENAIKGIWVWHNKIMASFDDTNNFEGVFTLAIFDPLHPSNGHLMISSGSANSDQPFLLSPAAMKMHTVQSPKRGRTIRIANDVFAVCERDDRPDIEGHETIHVFRALFFPSSSTHQLQSTISWTICEVPFFGLWSPGFYSPATSLTVSFYVPSDILGLGGTVLRAIAVDRDTGSLTIGPAQSPWRSLPTPALSLMHQRTDEFCVISGRFFSLARIGGKTELHMARYPMVVNEGQWW